MASARAASLAIKPQDKPVMIEATSQCLQGKNRRMEETPDERNTPLCRPPDVDDHVSSVESFYTLDDK
jgi:hypothetical protein